MVIATLGRVVPEALTFKKPCSTFTPFYTKDSERTGYWSQNHTVSPPVPNPDALSTCTYPGHSLSGMKKWVREKLGRRVPGASVATGGSKAASS